MNFHRKRVNVENWKHPQTTNLTIYHSQLNQMLRWLTEKKRPSKMNTNEPFLPQQKTNQIKCIHRFIQANNFVPMEYKWIANHKLNESSDDVWKTPKSTLNHWPDFSMKITQSIAALFFHPLVKYFICNCFCGLADYSLIKLRLVWSWRVCVFVCVIIRPNWIIKFTGNGIA